MTTPAPDAIITLRGVTKTYKKGAIEVQAVRGVDLTITKGEFIAISGPSGSGKTTLLNLMGALDTPTSGTIEIEGQDLGALGKRALAALRRDRIGFIFQAYNLVPVLTAYENAEIVMVLQGIPKDERKRRTTDLLSAVGLEGMEHRRPAELSGGQQQRVAIARAIASKPAVVLADEPTANVDSATAERLLGIMERLNQDEGVTFVFSTHDPRVMERAKREIHLVDGKTAEDVTR